MIGIVHSSMQELTDPDCHVDDDRFHHSACISRLDCVHYQIVTVNRHGCQRQASGLHSNLVREDNKANT